MIQNRPYIIGLTGSIASGKTNITRALMKQGAQVIDADEISRALTADGGKALAPIRESFGDVIFEGTSLNRKHLGEIVFADPVLRGKLNNIIHPLIYTEIEEQIQQHRQETALIIDVPLLFEAGWHSLCDEVWCTYAPVRTQVHRLRRRDGLSLHQAIRRIKSQMPGLEQCRRSDHCIVTTGTRKRSAEKALALWRDALRRANFA